MGRKAKNDNTTHGRGYVYCLQYHIVWCTKYRKHILTDSIRQECVDHLYKTAKECGFEIISMEVIPDHIHMLISCKPQHRISDLVKIMKGNTARWMFMEHPELKEQLWGGHLWNPTYFVTTASEVNAETVQNYIETQQNR